VVYPNMRAGVAQSVYRLGCGLDDRGSFPERDNDGIFLSSLLRPDRSPVQWILGVFTPRGEAD